MSKNRLAGLTSRALMLMAGGLLIMSYLSAVVNPAKIWIAALFGLMFIPLAMLNLFLLVWAIIRKSKAFLIPLAALLPSLFFIGSYYQAGGNEAEENGAEKEGVRILSYNVGRFSFDREAGRKATMDSIIAFIKKNDADIICLQEFRADNVQNAKRYLNSKFRGYGCTYYLYSGRGNCFGNVILSRFPARNKGVIKFERSKNLAIYTDFDIYGERLRVYDCHFESYSISLSGMIKSIGYDREIIKETGRKMRSSIIRRPKQVDTVFRHIESCPTGAIVCGDFNDNPMSYTYHKMSRGRRDGFIEAGKGFGATYSALWPLLRIDYILYPKDYHAKSHIIPRVRFSDHYPVITDIEIDI